MRKLMGFHILPLIALRYAIEEGLRFTYAGTEYDPRDFSYWGA